MKRIALLLFFSCLSLFCLTVKATAQDTFVQIVSEPGVSVFLDGDFKGVTSSEFNGLIIEDVQPGQRTIRVVKEGFNPQEETISIQAGEVYSHRVSPFVPSVRITEQGSEGDQSIDLQIGALMIQSLPVEIGIEIQRLGIDTQKTKDEWLAEDVPVGEYEAVFTRGSESLRYTIEIKQDMQTHLFVNTISKEVELKTAESISSSRTNQSGTRDTTTEISDVTNPATGQTWMDRNLGASLGANNAVVYLYRFRESDDPDDMLFKSFDETKTYGDLYQWGRAADGHEKRNSSTTSTLSSSDQPGHGEFILAPDEPGDWRSPQNNDLWQGEDGMNNPCPDGYRLPTEAEWEAERESWDTNDASGAFNSRLAFTMAGTRSLISSGPLSFLGSGGIYWSSTVSGSNARALAFTSSSATMHSFARVNAGSVRCIKD